MRVMLSTLVCSGPNCEVSVGMISCWRGGYVLFLLLEISLLLFMKVICVSLAGDFGFGWFYINRRRQVQ
uniref:Uncharacterized protein n=1 Tax=Physcomitrium patens TaxID=3218 RepID=A0A2K1KK57_PHYPA|nr:hypothetical protein PHYPA_007825 [Physcomitrium patens]PNR54155.1 hypothetical protein PHYPA_007831 [Physcomitrium patens]